MSNFTLQKYTTCPRCGSRWVINIRELSGRETYACENKCGMHAEWILLHTVEGYYLVVGEYHVHWYDNGKCAIWLEEPLIMLDEPLPFTITEEQIKVYLAFS